MRTIIYAIYNRATNQKVLIGWSYTKAKEVLAKMKEADPTADLVIAHKWKSF